MMEETDTGTIRTILRQYGFREDISEIVPLQETEIPGRLRILYRIRLEDDRDLVCRISCEEHCPGKLIEQQSIFSEKLRSHKIPVAKKYTAGSRYCITENYKGRQCSVTLEEFAGTDVTEMDEQLFGQLGRLLGRMHAVSLDDPSKIDFSPIGMAIRSGRARFSRLLENTGIDGQELPGIRKTAAEHDRLVYLLGNVLDSLPHGAVHGDLGISNNLVTSKGKLFIIDFNLAGDEPFLCDLFSCFYSSVYGYKWRDRLPGIDRRKAYEEYISAYCGQRPLTGMEKTWFGAASALFDGLYYCKEIIEEYCSTGDAGCLDKMDSAPMHFDVALHSWHQKKGR